MSTDGGALVAGRAAPGALIELRVDGAPVSQGQADAGGQFVAIFALEASSEPQVLTLHAEIAAGGSVAAAESVVLAPRAPAVAVEPEGPVDLAGAMPAGPEPGRVAVEGLVTAPEDATPDPSEPSEPRAREAVAQVPSAEPDMPLARQSEGRDGDPEAGTPSVDADGSAEAIALVESQAAEVISQPPPDFLLDRAGGVRLMDRAPDLVGNVLIDSIAYDRDGAVTIAGRVRQDAPGAAVRVYLNNRLFGETRAERGYWGMDLTSVPPGVHTLRVDELDDAGQVTSRFETPFLREDPATVAQLLGPEAAPASAVGDGAETPSPARAAVATAGDTEVAALTESAEIATATVETSLAGMEEGAAQGHHDTPVSAATEPQALSGDVGEERAEPAIRATTGDVAGAPAGAPDLAPINRAEDVQAETAGVAPVTGHAEDNRDDADRPVGDAVLGAVIAATPPEQGTSDNENQSAEAEGAARMASQPAATAAESAIAPGSPMADNVRAEPEAADSAALGPSPSLGSEGGPGASAVAPDVVVHETPEAASDVAASAVTPAVDATAAGVQVADAPPTREVADGRDSAGAQVEIVAEAGHEADPEARPTPGRDEAGATQSPPLTPPADEPSATGGDPAATFAQNLNAAGQGADPASASEAMADTQPANAPVQTARAATDTTPHAQAASGQEIAGPPAPGPDAPPRVSLITVQPGQSLWRISQEHYGAGERFVQIFHANRGQIRNPNLIFPGQIFALPD